MKKVKSCGILLFRTPEYKEFLLMKHPRRYDLPKGHTKKGEKDLSCAIREFEEETGIKKSDIEIINDYKFEYIYYPRYLFSFKKVEKTLIIYLAYLKKEKKIKLTEHTGYEWVKWAPPHSIQQKTIDPLLKFTEKFFEKNHRGLL